MFVARDAFDELVDIDMAQHDGVYFCPDCGAELIQRHGSIKLHHFAHKTLGDCITPREPMTQWHLDWQREFPESCREITMDSGGARHRADVVCGNVVLEFQHSSISEDAWRERTEFYMNDYDMWTFWVYDRTDSDIYTDIDLDCMRSFDAVLCGSDNLAKKEFKRTAAVMGNHIPLFLDYGPLVVLCSGFLAGCDVELSDRQACYARTCMIFTRAKFVEFVSEIGHYPKDVLEDFDVGKYISDHEDWFLENLRSVAGFLHRSDVDGLLSAYDKYVIGFSCRERVSGVLTASLKYLKNRRTCPLFDSHLDKAVIFNTSSDAYARYDDMSDYEYGQSCFGSACDIFKVDVSMIARAICSLIQDI